MSLHLHISVECGCAGIKEGATRFAFNGSQYSNIWLNECTETDVIMSGIAISECMEKTWPIHLAMFPIRSFSLFPSNLQPLHCLCVQIQWFAIVSIVASTVAAAK